MPKKKAKKIPKQKRRKKNAHDPMLIRGVVAILLLTLAIITTMSFFGRAGTIGVILNEWILSFLFGTIRYAVPAVLVVFAWYLVTDVTYQYRPTHTVGAIFFFLTSSSLLHLKFSPELMWFHALEGDGGGVFGMLAWPLKVYLGPLASWVVLIGLTVIALLLVFHTSIRTIIGALERSTEWIKDVSDQAKDAIANPVPTHSVRRESFMTDQDEPWEQAPLPGIDDADEEEEPEEESSPAVTHYADQAPASQSAKAPQSSQEETPQTSGGKTHVIEADDAPIWQQNVIIKPIPPLTLLEERKGKPSTGDIKASMRIIQETLKEFNIEVSMEGVRVGPSVTQYMLKPAKGVKLSKITSLGNDLALALAAHPIRIEAPIPGKALVGIEVPNNTTAMVSLRELIENNVFKSRKHDMMVGLGKDVGGKVWFADLPRMPHLLIAGSTGSGKTVCMNTIITSLLYQNTAETLRMIMVDPKRVELTLYNGIPHLLTPVITNASQTVNALKWTIGEMDRRFEVLNKAGNRDITTYNKAHPNNKLPYIVFIIDELADLMVTASNDVETGIIRLAQMARAVGIHLIVATQRPSVDVITGLMKANIPGRIAFSVASLTDSRTILDAGGAEQLIGKGDMLLQSADVSKPVRIQGAFISEEEAKRVIDYLKGDEEPVYDTSIIEKNSDKNLGPGGLVEDDNTDELFDDAKDAILEAGKASASFLQRKLRVGYARAARILDELEDAGIVGPQDGAKPRDILMTKEEIESTMDSGGEMNVFTQKTPPQPNTQTPPENKAQDPKPEPQEDTSAESDILDEVDDTGEIPPPPPKEESEEADDVPIVYDDQEETPETQDEETDEDDDPRKDSFSIRNITP